MGSEEKFPIRKIKHVRISLSESETDLLSRHGRAALELATGARLPSNDGQRQFCLVCRGEVPPQTNFERLWIRYNDAAAADQKIEQLSEEVAQLSRKVTNFERAIFIAESEKVKLLSSHDSQIQKLCSLIAQYERKLGINQPEPRSPMDRYEVGTDDWREQS
jgi:uncharacterized protein YifE (UPF0438 family)